MRPRAGPTRPAAGMAFLTIIPLSAWALALLVLKSRGLEWRVAFLASGVLWGCWVTFLTEALSLLSALSPYSLAAGWAIFGAVAAVPLFRAESLRRARSLPVLSGSEKLIIAVTGCMLGSIFLIAILSPPQQLGLTDLPHDSRHALDPAGERCSFPHQQSPTD